MQTTTGYKDVFIPILNIRDNSMFALSIDNNNSAPMFVKGDLLIISPEVATRSGDVSAVEYGNETTTRTIMQVTFSEDFIVLESLNRKQAPIALVRGKDHFRVIGKVIQRIQKLS